MKKRQKAEMEQLILDCLAGGQSLSAFDLHARIFERVKERYLEKWERFPNRGAIYRLCSQMVEARKLVKSWEHCKRCLFSSQPDGTTAVYLAESRPPRNQVSPK